MTSDILRSDIWRVLMIKLLDFPSFYETPYKKLLTGIFIDDRVNV